MSHALLLEVPGAKRAADPVGHLWLALRGFQSSLVLVDSQSVGLFVGPVNSSDPFQGSVARCPDDPLSAKGCVKRTLHSDRFKLGCGPQRTRPPWAPSYRASIPHLALALALSRTSSATRPSKKSPWRSWKWSPFSSTQTFRIALLASSQWPAFSRTSVPSLAPPICRFGSCLRPIVPSASLGRCLGTVPTGHLPHSE